jgi:hypothetical protein
MLFGCGLTPKSRSIRFSPEAGMFTDDARGGVDFLGRGDACDMDKKSLCIRRRMGDRGPTSPWLVVLAVRDVAFSFMWIKGLTASSVSKSTTGVVGLGLLAEDIVHDAG